MSQKNQSLILGLITIILWGSLATLGNLLIHLPPFYLMTVCFFVGSLPAFKKPREMFPSFKVSAFGIAGYFGYHFFLFYAFRFAPAIEANLINYMWPVFMVLFSPIFFSNNHLKWYHLLGGFFAMIGCFILVFGQGGEFDLVNLKGYIFALLAAIIWPVFSLGSKKLPESSVYSVGGYCLGAGILCFITHLLIEPHVVLQFHDAWKLLLLGFGPFGLAFYCWDQALKKGDTRVLGALSYLTPVLSTLGLILFTDHELKNTTAIAMLLIIGGASSGFLDFLPSKTLKKGE